MSRNEHCEGCNTYNGHGVNCSYIEWNSIGTCPCMICIVKVMCSKTCNIWKGWKNDRRVSIIDSNQVIGVKKTKWG